MDVDAQKLLPLSFGWYGKLPARGDFVGRGLPRAWVRQWDAWMQRAMAQAASEMGEIALRDRLAALPPWQCMVLPQRAGDPVWCGVLAGSTDRVGRVFPLLVAEAFAWPALGAVDLGELQQRGRAIADWLAAAQRLDPKQFDAGAAPFAAMPLRCPGPEDTRPGLDVQGLCMDHPQAASLWWRGMGPGDVQPQPWPPSDRWLWQLIEWADRLR